MGVAFGVGEMHISETERLLTEAQICILEGRQLIERQRKLIADLEASGQKTDAAQALLNSLIEAQRRHEETRNRLLEKLNDERIDE